MDAVFADIVRLRNEVREELMRELAKPPAPPTIRIRRGPPKEDK
jgi:hypothetical protein